MDSLTRLYFGMIVFGMALMGLGMVGKLIIWVME